MSKPFVLIYSITTFFGLGLSTVLVVCGVAVFCFTAVLAAAGDVVPFVLGFDDGCCVAPDDESVLETGGFMTAGLCSTVGGGTSLYWIGASVVSIFGRYISSSCCILLCISAGVFLLAHRSICIPWSRSEPTEGS